MPSKPAHSHGPIHWNEVFQREFKDESDRASVILAAAMLDAALEAVLKAFLMPTSAADDSLFEGGNAPLGTFSSRIELCYRLGLLDACHARNFHLVRKLRNDFAHNITGCTFADSSVIGRLAELRRSTGLPEKAKDIRDAFVDGPKGDFQMIVSWMQWGLRDVAENVSRVSPSHHLVGEFIRSNDNEGAA